MPDYERRLTKLEEANGLTGGVHVVKINWVDEDPAAQRAEKERALRANPPPAAASLIVFLTKFSSLTDTALH